MGLGKEILILDEKNIVENHALNSVKKYDAHFWMTWLLMVLLGQQAQGSDTIPTFQIRTYQASLTEAQLNYGGAGYLEIVEPIFIWKAATTAL